MLPPCAIIGRLAHAAGEDRFAIYIYSAASPATSRREHPYRSYTALMGRSGKTGLEVAPIGAWTASGGRPGATGATPGARRTRSRSRRAAWPSAW
jgi:hypothetical protein